MHLNHLPHSLTTCICIFMFVLHVFFIYCTYLLLVCYAHDFPCSIYHTPWHHTPYPWCVVTRRWQAVRRQQVWGRIKRWRSLVPYTVSTSARYVAAVPGRQLARYCTDILTVYGTALCVLKLVADELVCQRLVLSWTTNCMPCLVYRHEASCRTRGKLCGRY